MRLDDVEVKVGLDSDQTAKAVQALGLPAVAPWSIFFVEDVTTGLCSATPLLDQRLILRARQKTSGKDDVTVKFRPGRRSQLTDEWLDEKSADFKIEEDWAADRRTLAISLTSDRPKGLVAAVAAGEQQVSALFTADHLRLIEQCAGVAVNLTTLTMLPPVSAMRWPKFAAPRPGGSPLDVRAERWTVGDLDFLELSIVEQVADAPAAQAALIAFVEGKGLVPSTAEAKTTQVMRALVAQAAC
ncbi:hypothetical protein GCM10010168_51980 [Actinoplanes ianthinogenes]|uniref:CYTH domain-containing protein n=1 Tax=Actinoplanes ianthinogenes TaxID=122358 RepID=A0ABN6CQ26_9ACTN|nr:hypothetical protein [Actinoplanes ianthinogenes]BCJ46247.1 hypothetical protein Aiant_69040 [Actinoplanes ianthinogenes]GGR27346.1 hypothetical protein GCM10010168_51980 [Actinoplanes ianthinogenes]